MNLKKLSTQNFLIILLTIIISIFSISFLWIKDIYSHYQNDYKEIKNNYINSQKQMLKLHVDTIGNNIENIIKINQTSKISSKEVQKVILDQLKNYRFGKDGYLFVLTTKGVDLMNPFKPELTGKNLFYLKDKKGKYFIQEIIKAANSNKNSFVTYFWVQPSTNKVVQKIAYVKKIPQWNWIIGSGIYTDTINQVLKIKHQELKKSIEKRIIEVIILFILIVLLISFFVYRRIKKINSSFLMFHNFLKEAHKSSNLMDLDKFQYKEFKELGKDINSMLTKRIKMEKELEEKKKQLIEQSRFARMGELLNMIAHQWRQPLTAISATSLVINLKAKMNELDNKTAIKLSNNIIEYTEHLSETIDDFRDFFKPHKEKSETNWEEIIKSVFKIVKIPIENKNISLKTEIECKENFISYSNELKQVLLNLIKNAEDILIEKKIKDPYIKIKTFKEKNSCVLEISDNGGGIPTELLEKIFDPYFSTKTEKNGTGLGLYMSKIMIEKHCKGKLSVRNSNEGAVFRIEIPLT